MDKNIISFASRNGRLLIASVIFVSLWQAEAKSEISQLDEIIERIGYLRTSVDATNSQLEIDKVIDYLSKQDSFSNNEIRQIDQLGALLSSFNMYDRSEELFFISSEIAANKLGSTHPSTLLLIEGLADSLRGQSKFDRSENLYRKLENKYTEIYGDASPNVANVKYKLALLHYSNGNFNESKHYFSQSYTLFANLFGDSHANSINSRYGIAASNRNLKKFNEAIIILIELASDIHKYFGRSSPRLIDNYTRTAKVYELSGNLDDARKLYKEAISLMEINYRFDHPKGFKAIISLAELSAKRGDSNEAIKLFRRARKLAPEIKDTTDKTIDEIDQSIADLMAISNSGNIAESAYPNAIPDELQALLESANSGDTKAMYTLAERYREGVGAQKSNELAFEWFLRAADGGSIKGAARLADFYRQGIGTARDLDRAVELYRMSASSGEPSAMWALGTAYLSGEGVERDKVKAKAWYQRAFDTGVYGLSAENSEWYNELFKDERGTPATATISRVPIEANLMGWQELKFDDVKPNLWREDAGALVVEGDGSVSIVYRRTNISPASTPILRWKWRVDQGPPETDLTRKGGDDRAISLTIGFAYDATSATMGESMKRLIVENVAGADAPGRVIDFAWSGANVPGQAFESPYSGYSGRVISMQRDASNGEWVEENINVAKLYREQWGSEPTAITSIAVTSDGDDTGSVVSARIRDIVFEAE